MTPFERVGSAPDVALPLWSYAYRKHDFWYPQCLLIKECVAALRRLAFRLL